MADPGTAAQRGSDLKYGHGSALWTYWTRGDGFAKWSGAVHKWTTLHALLLKAGVPAHSADGLTTNIITAVMPGYMKLAHAKKAGRSEVETTQRADPKKPYGERHLRRPQERQVPARHRGPHQGRLGLRQHAEERGHVPAQRRHPLFGQGPDPGGHEAHRSRRGRRHQQQQGRVPPGGVHARSTPSRTSTSSAPPRGRPAALVEAYAAVFDDPAEIVDHEGHYVEDIDRAAFNKVDRRRRPVPRRVRPGQGHLQSRDDLAGHPERAVQPCRSACPSTSAPRPAGC